MDTFPPVVKTSSQVREEPYAWANHRDSTPQINPFLKNNHSEHISKYLPIGQNDKGPSQNVLNTGSFYEKLAEPEKVKKVKKNLFGSSPEEKSKQNQLFFNKIMSKKKNVEWDSSDETGCNSPVFGVEVEKKKPENIISGEYRHPDSEQDPR
jgi:hypothetical protein